MPNIQVLNDSMEAAADYSAAAYQYRFVRISDDRKVTVGVQTAGDLAYGILQNDPETNQAANIAVLGISQLQLGDGGASAGNRLKSDTNGRGIEADTAGDAVMAIAREDGSSGEEISVFIIHDTYYTA